MSGGARARWQDEDMADEITRRAVRFIDEHREEPFFLYFATLAALVEHPLPEDAGPDSFNLRPALLAAAPARPVREHLVTQAGYVQGPSLREGPWKHFQD